MTRKQLVPNYTTQKDDWTPNTQLERPLNRAERRRYVRQFQDRNGRLHLMGWGSWRRHKPRTEESYAWLTRITPDSPEGKEQRRRYNRDVYRAHRTSRLRGS